MAASTSVLLEYFSKTDVFYLSKESFQKLHQLADEQQNPVAMFNLGKCYFKGCAATQKNFSTSLKYFQKAHQAQDLNAKALLALWFQHGALVEKNTELASKYFEELVQAGYPNNMADPCFGIECFYKAAEQGNASAQMYIALWLLHPNNLVVPRDKELAITYFKQARSQNHTLVKEVRRFFTTKHIKLNKLENIIGKYNQTIPDNTIALTNETNIGIQIGDSKKMDESSKISHLSSFFELNSKLEPETTAINVVSQVELNPNLTSETKKTRETTVINNLADMENKNQREKENSIPPHNNLISRGSNSGIVKEKASPLISQTRDTPKATAAQQLNLFNAVRTDQARSGIRPSLALRQCGRMATFTA